MTNYKPPCLFDLNRLSFFFACRAEKASGSETSELINSYIKDGKIVPAKITVELLKKAMEESGKNKFLIDGFPRSKENLDSFYTVMGDAFTLNMVLEQCQDLRALCNLAGDASIF